MSRYPECQANWLVDSTPVRRWAHNEKEQKANIVLKIRTSIEETATLTSLNPCLFAAWSYWPTTTCAAHWSHIQYMLVFICSVYIFQGCNFLALAQEADIPIQYIVYKAVTELSMRDNTRPIWVRCGQRLRGQGPG